MAWTPGIKLLIPAAFLYGCVALTPASRAEKADAVDFQRHIAPILRDRCIRCHSPTTAQGTFSLTSPSPSWPDDLVVSGQPDNSLLLDVLTSPSNGERPLMPKEGEPLSPQEVELIRRWIQRDAKWPKDYEIPATSRAGADWWSVQPLTVVLPPDPDGLPDAWMTNPIDRFVFARLATKGLRPSPPADARTMLRRVYFDLIGLPPTPEQVAKFSANPTDEAYERIVDSLLESPRYGERWGRHWLDVVRFGESSGYEVNHIRDNAWPFRDYVIRSFNEDKPFDQFVLEQLAGDVVAPGDPSKEVGTGFLVAGSYDKVGNQDPAAQKIIRANTLDDIIATTGAAFLGLTVNCCRCHDHKFDPILQKDYYRLQAVFAGVVQADRVLATAEERARFSERREPIERELRDANLALEAAEDVWRSRFQSTRDQKIRDKFPRAQVSKYETTETFKPTRARFVRMTVQRSTGNGKAGVNLDEFEVYRAGDKNVNVALAANGGKATVRTSRYSNDDPTVYGAHHLIDGKYSAFWISAEAGGQLTISLAEEEVISRVVWSVDRIRSFGPKSGRPFSAEYEIEVSLDGESWSVVASDAGRRPFDDDRLDELLLLSVMSEDEKQERRRLLVNRNQIQRKLKSISDLPRAWIGQFRQPSEATYVMIGGDPSRRGETVAPESLSTLEHVTQPIRLDVDAKEGDRRVALAQWITDKHNPLTPRVLANRIWQYHFGRGIVSTPSDFGYNGGRPTHPQLLDWLAHQIHAHDWRWKPIHKQICMSATYRQSSRYDSELAAVDAEAEYLWRFPPRRLTAEAIRDSVLQIAGKLDLSMGGPGFRLFRYTVDNVATYYPLDDVGPETYRRAVYHQNPRSVRVDMLVEYDLPDCGLPAPRRVVTTSPLQALVQQNHQFIFDIAHFMAERLETDCSDGDVASQVDRAYQLAFCRQPDADERAAATEFVGQYGLALFCRALLNANELIYIY